MAISRIAGNPAWACEVWEETGFEAGEVDEWLNACCFDPDTAEDMDDVGINPEMASMQTEAGNGDYVDTVGYKVAAGDLGLEEACELVGVRLANPLDAPRRPRPRRSGARP
jgi:hypothetical protein